jgi:aryl-alcohol dehydrogenase-like predicted oxidoreductase
MDRITLGPTGFQVSRVGFGCAQLMGRVGAAEGRRALDLAFDLGVNYFDTARSYGYGESEGLVGEFLRGKRDRVVVATKFGIDARRVGVVKRTAKALLRQTFRMAPFLRTAARATLGAQFATGKYTRDHLLRSIERSLRELRTDYVDIFLIHDCRSDIWAKDETFEGLRQLVQAGKVRAIGAAADTSAFTTWNGPSHRAIDVAQFPFNLFDQRAASLLLEAPHRASVGTVAYQPFGGGGEQVEALRRGLAEFIASPGVSAELRSKLSRPSAEAMADLAINAAIRAAPIDVVLCSMVRAPHVHANVAAANATRFTVEDLLSVRRWFAAQRASASTR